MSDEQIDVMADDGAMDAGLDDGEEGKERVSRAATATAGTPIAARATCEESSHPAPVRGSDGVAAHPPGPRRDCARAGCRR